MEVIYWNELISLKIGRYELPSNLVNKISLRKEPRGNKYLTVADHRDFLGAFNENFNVSSIFEFNLLKIFKHTSEIWLQNRRFISSRLHGSKD